MASSQHIFYLALSSYVTSQVTRNSIYIYIKEGFKNESHKIYAYQWNLHDPLHYRAYLLNLREILLSLSLSLSLSLCVISSAKLRFLSVADPGLSNVVMRSVMFPGPVSPSNPFSLGKFPV